MSHSTQAHPLSQQGYAQGAYKDPVCGMTVDPASASASCIYKGQTYYFCCSGCLTKFQGNEEQYLTNNATTITQAAAVQIQKDPVCGMTVDPASAAAQVEHQGKTYYFCCQGCAQKFSANPTVFLEPGKPEFNVVEPTNDKTYTCPMHPEIVAEQPGDCPACGMPLEPTLANTEDDGSEEVANISQRLRWSVLLTVPVVLLSMVPMINMGSMATGMSMAPHLVSCWLQFVIATPVVVWVAYPFFRRGWASIKNRSLNMFTLLSLGIAIPYGYSLLSLLAVTFVFTTRTGHHMVYFEASAVITTLAWVGQYLEAKARVGSADAIRELMRLVPTEATVILSDDSESTMPIGEILLNTKVRVRPGERIPVDGRVLDGTSYVDESMLTGESVATLKQPTSCVSAGTINGNGSLVIQTEKIGNDTLLSQIVKLVSQAQRSRVPVQQLVDKIAAIFVPAVIIVALVTLSTWMLLGAELIVALSAAVAVLVVACPCALGLATPMSIIVAAGRASKAGVLFKEARTIQRLAGVNTLVLDKTGTLTEGKPGLTQITSAGNLDDKELLSLAVAVERYSEHPLASAILATSLDEGVILATCQNFVSTPGAGVTGNVAGRVVSIGTVAYLAESGVDCSAISLGSDNRTSSSVFVAVDRKYEGRLDFADQLRPTALHAVEQLRQSGVRIVIATGDNEQAARSIADTLGIREVYARLLPADKAALVQTLQRQGAKVAMAGDGINDAPALAQADVGIAMSSGTDIAMHSADIVLVHSDVAGIVRARKISSAMLRNISQNLFLAFAYNLLAIPAAAGLLEPVFGFTINPMAAAAAMSLSSVAVIANALRLSRLEL